MKLEEELIVIEGYKRTEERSWIGSIKASIYTNSVMKCILNIFKRKLNM